MKRRTLGIFNKDEMEYSSDYGYLISKNTFINKLEEALERHGIIFEPDYMYGDYVQESTAEEILIAISKINTID